MKRIRQYIARISRTEPRTETDSRLSSSATTSRSSIDEDATGILVLQEGQEPENERGIDIVFVHCIGGSRIRSWTKHDVCWPRDLLGREFPHARILTWGYTLPMLNNSNVSEHLERPLADSLIIDLSKVSRKTSRQIIFVAHGLGGMIVKEALSAAAVSQIYGKYSEMADIYTKTIGILFLGTPHRSTERLSLEDVFAQAAVIEMKRSDEAFVQLIKKRVESWATPKDDFVAFSRDMSVVCVRELIPVTTPTMSTMVPKSCATYEGLNVVSDDILADHFNIARFSDRQDPGYFQLVGHLSRMSRRSQSTDTEAKAVRGKEILDALYFDTQNKREPSDDSFDQTCASIVAGGEDQPSSGFYRWCRSPETLFWISGNAGSGKTTLMRHLFHNPETRTHLEQWAGEGTTVLMVSTYLCESGEQVQKSQEGIYRSILHQILTARPDLVPVCFPSFMDGPWPPPIPFNTVVNLMQAFYQLLSKMGRTFRLVVFLDAIDEYRSTETDDFAARASISGESMDSDSQNSVLGSKEWIASSHMEIARLCSEFSFSDAIKAVISSRELPIFEETFSQISRMRVHARTQNVISQYCADRLDDVSPGLSSGQQHLCNEVARLSNGDFLWARLAINILMEGSLKSLRHTLDNLPTHLMGLDGLYMRIIQDLSPAYQREACRIIEITLRCRDPPDMITLALADEGYLARKELRKQNPELGELLVHHDKAKPMSESDAMEISRSMEHRLATRCAGFLEKREGSQRVAFMHLTTKEFLSRPSLWDKLSVMKPSSVELDYSLISANVRYLRYLARTRSIASRRTRFRIEPSIWLIIGNTLRYAGRVDDKPFDFKAYVELLDELDETCREGWKQAVRDFVPAPTDLGWSNKERAKLMASSWASFEPMDVGNSPSRHNFLALAIQANLLNYVSAKLMLLDEAERATEAQALLQYAVCPEGDIRSIGGSMVSSCAPLTGSYKDFHHDLPDANFIRLLLTCGASMRHQQAQDVWKRVLQAGQKYFSQEQSLAIVSIGATAGQATNKNRRQWVAIVTILLDNGANPQLQVETGGGHNDGSVEIRAAIDIIGDILAGEEEFARDLLVIEAAAVRESMARKTS
ncbi:hypothetical protein PFICI_08857 [Pestalotiopsis fici W106-1]|uniref:DUF676 domain-containing protein n=1 Tax=Pestalotiopsis fici (strain W106-1 / CGMCC3.15140) TaxID=1229662 RepID=W3WYZ3_PESFW|nr:uncharacterized protein PFICI_08857 [Pestalotiopsis fici W106-1]ETS79004.1 hypothetical protein PFICI_08857 [Pestalotiopsis fici W106-1]